MSNAAQNFLNALESQDSNTVYSALEDAAKSGDVQENQDWKNGKSTWTFEDGSSIVMEGSDVTVESASLPNQYSVSVFDYNPADGGGCAWGQEFVLRLSNPPRYGQRSIDVRNANASQAEELEGQVRKAAVECGEYGEGDRLWLQFSDDEYGTACWAMRV